ncbi:membrane protein [Alkalihalobacillus alcalophilus ATCC 27647 = CGMCC 1.3604]|uniref:Membrane protein n=2 Tax=Alkalihalobacillus alcalophilus ATCC 27647 = CGMCC 1.3604 TaxID=1218173 RepID=A0A4S4JZU4_ALKAL|nr:membrane protein [Alkalihalobacillus alcalophilus ATCC 27647 = CGMCC 1.3604]
MTEKANSVVDTDLEDTSMKPSRIMKWTFGGLEAIWGIPILGGLLIIGLAWVPLVIMLILHIIGLVFASKENRSKTGHILGILASALGWIPGVGMILHILAAIFLMIEAGKNN